jgi:SAM-dependent methyltransferase
MILDACCGGRMMWFDKNHDDAVFMDCDVRPRGTIPQQPNFNVRPEVIADYRDIPFADETFDLVVFDPPHITNCQSGSIMRNKYGSLNPMTWRFDLAEAFEECWRVLRGGGSLVFKWGEARIPVKEVLEILPQRPLFGHTTAKSGKTKWICFHKERQ